MIGNRKFAWITAAVDEETALQSIVLAKSLSRVVTVADTVILVSKDVPEDLGKFLTKVFNDVISIDLGSSKSRLHKMELLITHAWNVGSYTKCVFLSPNKMIVRNCDELFDTQDEFMAATMNGKTGKQIDVSVMCMKPGFNDFMAINKLAVSGQYIFLSDILGAYIVDAKKGELSHGYNFDVQNMSLNNINSVINIKILSGCGTTGGNHHVSLPEIFQESYTFWHTLWKETEIELKIMASGKELKQDFVDKNVSSIEKTDHYKHAIAIVGHSCRFPGANSIDEFWELIKNGGDGIRSVPVERLSESQLNDARYTESKAGFLKCPISEFDAKFFGISPREAAFMDPQQRLLAEVAWEALENAAIDPHSLKGSNTGVFTGIWTQDYERLIAENSTAQDFHHVILGNAFSATSARVSYFLGLNGPNVATESGCSSSMVALHLACDSLRKRETNLGLVLGANLIIIPLPLSEISILAKDGHCKTFDESADGFGRAEGVATIVLKRLPDAIKNGDRIMGIIRGTALSNEGTSSNFGTPSKLCQQIAINDALNNARVKPGDVDYVEAHGTGTPIGDPIEFAAISAGYTGEREKPLLIGSVKTNTGHTESSAGLAGLIKVILAMEHEEIPPHRNFTKLNPSIDLDVVPAVIPLELTPWSRNSERPRIAGVSSFGISGTNVHVVVEEPPCDNKTRPLELHGLESDKSHHILTLSAKSENALKDLTSLYAKYLKNHPDVSVSDLTHTCNTGRAHHKHRLAVIGKSVADFQKALDSDVQIPPALHIKPKVAFLFTGQGSQYYGMAKSLFQSSFVFRQAFSECQNLVYDCNGISLQNALWVDADSNLLDQTICSQLSIFAVEYGLLKMWESVGIIPDIVLGHSVGEYAAAVAAGIINLKDAITLLAERSRLIQSLPPGGMIAIRSSNENVFKLISAFLNVNFEMWLDVAVINSQEETVVAGSTNSIEAFKMFCENNEVKFQVLAASHAFHSREMEKIAKKFGEFSSKMSYMSPKCLYVSGTTGNIISSNEMEDGSYWVRHARESVNFQKGICTLGDFGSNVFVEIGAHPVLLALGMSNLKDSDSRLWLPSLRKNKDDWETILNSIGTLYANGMNINWKSIDNCCALKKLQLPTYPFQRQRYWTETPSDCSEKIIHPLLGRKIVLADLADHVYEHKWNLNDLQYVKDHQVAHVIVLPGAGFLEIILAAGKNIFQKNIEDDLGVLTVQDFVVEAPLELEEGIKYKTQVVASPVENKKNTYHVKVHVFKNLNGYNDEKGWKRYSSAYVSLTESSNLPIQNSVGEGEIISGQDKEDPKISYFIEEIDTIKNRCQTELDSKEFYKLAPEIGIYFGDNFQSIDSVSVGDNEAVGLIPTVTKAGNVADYIYHPIILDAMIQLFGLSMGRENIDLYLPIGVEQVILVNDSVVEDLFAHAKWSGENSVGTVALYSKKNVLLVLMVGVRLMKTSVSSFLNVVNAQKNMLPGMYQTVFRQRIGPVQARVDVSKIIDAENVIIPFFECMEQHEHLYSVEVHQKSDEGVRLNIIKILIQNGFTPKVGVVYWMEELFQNYVIKGSHRWFVKRFFEILCQDGYGIEIDSGSGFMDGWKCTKEFPTIEEIDKIQEEINEFIYVKDAPEGRTVVSHILQKSYSHIWDVLLGKKTAVSALFESDFNLLDIYTKSNECVLANLRLAKYLGLALQRFKSDPKKEDSIVRIIEIGAGSGATTKEIVTILQKEEIPFRYTFTDISPHFFEGAKEQFSAINGIDYKVLDIEKDPTSQEFCLHHYDIVVASNVLHTGKTLKTSLINARKLIRTNGILVLEEITRPSRALDTIYGILDGYWSFTDYDIRPRHIMTTVEIWNKLMIETGFTKAVNLSGKDEFISCLTSRAVDLETIQTISLNNKNDVSTVVKKTAWIIFGEIDNLSERIKEKLAQICDEVIIVNSGGTELENEGQRVYYHDVTNDSSVTKIATTLNEKYVVKGIIYSATMINCDNKEMAYRSFLNVGKFISEAANNNFQLLVVTRGVYYIQNQKDLTPCNAAILGMSKSLVNEVSSIQGKMVDLDPDECDFTIESQQIFFELFDRKEPLVCYRSKKRFVSRLVSLPRTLAPLTLPQGRYTIEIPKSKKINDVSFTSMEKIPLGPKDIEVVVKAVALNFRDIFVIIKPDMFASLKETIGSDFSGIVSKVGSQVTKFNLGDEVYGVSLSSSVASHAITHEDIVIHKPKEMTFTEAATLPSVLMTAFYCMVTVADLQKGETILIHVASGGVGLIAIQIAKNIGAEIIATAGSHRKRNYLRTLGIEHVFHSRDLTFGDEISRVTNGRGVDMVLNSLTGHGFKETTLKACALNARFVEIGKVNIWKPEEVSELRPDVQYTIVDLEKSTTTEMGKLIDEMKSQSKEDYKALPYSRYDVVNIRDALNYFLKANHIGKIVVTMPDMIETGNQILRKDVIFNPNATYLITGGLGGIGLEVAKWMTESGCKCLVLVGRSAPNEAVLQVLSNLRAKGCKIFSFQVDVGNWDQCNSLFETISSSVLRLPPLRGVIHSAGVISDAIFMNQTWERYEAVFNAKIAGCLNLHKLTKYLHLEHFVLFSSMAGLFGPMAQSNHAAANAFLDSFAHYRHSIGLPAQTINWGGWAEIGAASNTVYGNEGALGVKPFTPNQGIASLKFIMSRPDLLQVGVIQIDFSEFSQHFDLGNLLSELTENADAKESSLTSIQSETFWNEIGPLSVAERTTYIKAKLTAIIRKTLKLPELEAIDEFQTFQEMGLDSLMAVEMKNKLQGIVGKRITLNVSAMMDHPTINSLGKFLAEKTLEADLENDGAVKNEVAEFDVKAMYELVKQDFILVDSIQGRNDCTTPSEVKTVLLTGSTGHLGAYILRELSKIGKLNCICLIRGKSVEHARRKLIANLKKYAVLDDINLDNISIILGDITDENLGFPIEEYHRLSSLIDMVFHLAAKANHVEKYLVAKGHLTDIRSVNVLGTVNIIKFAARFKTKRIVFPSSFTAINRLTDDGFICEDFPDNENNADDLTLGYSVTKFVCEKLLRQANERGIPCTVIRYSSLLGHSETGLFVSNTNSAVNQLLLSLRFGMVADVESCWFGIPVDTASKLTLELVFNDKVESGVFNIVQPVPTYAKDIIAVAKRLGFNLELVTLKEYEEKVKKEIETSSFLAVLKDSYGENGEFSYTELSKTHPKMRQFLEKGINTNRISEKCKELIPDINDRIPHPQNILYLYLEFAHRSGIFEKFGIKVPNPGQ